ncbi:MFS transporter [Segniliparus rugosus]|uniref:Major facilitator superfamily (MFS) profile domain-containing protein n=1 Tax=Segniliparus rugosus (strain ATCC BAA-974 / DSM 45345 / CCUG 50838 / CIP 108380 / JCM 13579 / CDC 945) TaxID=679197 RepID=E5XMX7_SEGRC|nr:MFS transporter [Segniliparus rugosus]EFV14303.1 hypothetical protein HMPREF9336_00847 [Segniliparus rugosus ATCC BAA-974]
MTTTTGALSSTRPKTRRTPEQHARARRWQWQIFAITWIAYAGYYFTREGFAVAKLGILADPVAGAALPKENLAVVDSVYLAFYMVGQFTWGSVADRYGPRVVVLCGLAVSALCTLCMGFLPTLAFFAALMAVEGLAQATGWAPLLKNVSSFFSVERRGRVLGLWSTNYSFGGLAAPLFLGYVAYSVFDDWRVAFFTGSATVATVFCLVLLFQRNSPESVGLTDSRVLATGAASDEAVPGSAAGALREALRNRLVVALAAAYFLLKPARYMLLLWGPVIVAERLGLGKDGKFEAVVVPAAFGAAGVVAPIVFGHLSDTLFRKNRIWPCVVSLGASCVFLAAFVPLTATKNVWAMTALLAAIGFFLYAADAMISCVAVTDAGSARSAATSAGLVNGAGSAGAILGGLLPGFLSTGVLFCVFAATAFAAMLILIPFRRARMAQA